MKKIVIQGGYKLRGTIDISGSKNASLPILAATLLIDQKIILENVPMVKLTKEMFDKVNLELWDDARGCDNSAIGVSGCYEPWTNFIWE